MDLTAQREYAWSYFQLHSAQRMTTFNFFVVIAALLTTALAGTFDAEYKYHSVGIALGLGMIVMAYVFWKLDQRVRYLVKHAEGSLKAIERALLSEDSTDISSRAVLFSREEEETKAALAENSPNLWKWHLSYSKCFGAVYLSFGLLGVLGVLGSAHAYFNPVQV